MSQRQLSLPHLSLTAGQVSTLLDSARELIAILTPDGTILYASPGFTRVLGYRVEDLTGRSITALIHPDEVAAARDFLRELPTTSHTKLGESLRLRGMRDDSWRWFEVTGRNRLSEPAIEGLVVSFLDVTELRRMEEERQVIADIVHALNQTSNLDQLLTRIHQALRKVVYAENCYVALHEP